MLLIGSFILALLAISSILSLVYPIGGAWERMSGKNQSIWDRERMILKQLGPLVTGTQTVHGGNQRFLGLAFGPSVWLKRRDFGIQALIQEGFPENVAPLVQGRVLLRLRLKLSSDKLFLKGQAIPFRVEFYEDGSGIKSIRPVDPTERSYRRAELTPVAQKISPLGQKLSLNTTASLRISKPF